ncbi:hypothetical protein Taro_029288 [Colocasia esculenta]|uniref:Uncharacterized protein n=1 Tax=Colocasia esculenta TaxID=4460 RepID=A0A843VZU8_COLES|nr:hypothetical protein [Colocasia esculenta]
MNMLERAFSPRILLLLDLLTTSSKPQQRFRAGHGELRERPLFWCIKNSHFPNMESYLNPVYSDENQDAAFYTSQHYEESLPHDLFEESAQPWVAIVHASESHHLNDDGPSQSVFPPQANDQVAQLMRLIPQLDQSQIHDLMTALKRKTVS